jgi:type IV secretory pathway TrbF-like protein
MSTWLTARGEFEGVYANLARGKRNWQLVAFGLLAVLLIETLGFVRLALTARVTPYVVEVDKLGLAACVGAGRAVAAHGYAARGVADRRVCA